MQHLSRKNGPKSQNSHLAPERPIKPPTHHPGSPQTALNVLSFHNSQAPFLLSAACRHQLKRQRRLCRSASIFAAMIVVGSLRLRFRLVGSSRIRGEQFIIFNAKRKEREGKSRIRKPVCPRLFSTRGPIIVAIGNGLHAQTFSRDRCPLSPDLFRHAFHRGPESERRRWQNHDRGESQRRAGRRRPAV